MKNVKYLGTLICALLMIVGCDDNTGSLGMDMLPNTDLMNTKTKIYDISTRSMAVPSSTGGVSHWGIRATLHRASATRWNEQIIPPRHKLKIIFFISNRFFFYFF